MRTAARRRGTPAQPLHRRLLLLLLLRQPSVAVEATVLTASDLVTNSSSGQLQAANAFDLSPTTVATLQGPGPWLEARFGRSWSLYAYRFSAFLAHPTSQPTPTGWVARCEKRNETATWWVEVDSRANVTISSDPFWHAFEFDNTSTLGCGSVRFDFELAGASVPGTRDPRPGLPCN